MFSGGVRAILALLTDIVLEKYVAHLFAERARCGNVLEEAFPSTTSIEELLAPLLLIHGKVFTSAVGIVLHGAEPVVRYVTCDTIAENSDGKLTEAREEQDVTEAEGNFFCNTRCVYFVGEHRLLSLFYCPCVAYGYQGIRRQEAWLCKHLLALRMALLLEKRGLVKDIIRERRVSVSQLQELLQQVD